MFYPFWYRFLSAQDAGLNREASIMVANQEMTLEEALGDMDVEFEVGEMLAQAGPVSDDGYDCECRGAEYCTDCIPF